MNRPARPWDWSDCHRGAVAAEITTARDAFETAFARLPKIVDLALVARDRIVGRFGLKTVTESALSMASLPIIAETPERYEVGLEDTHLTFSLETRLAQQQVAVTTRIWFNHWSGRAYLGVVLLPHKWIVRRSIRGLA